MAIVQYKEWVIAVDEEKTRDIYKIIPESESEVYRKYQISCDHLSDDEWRFFRRFGIDSKRCSTVVCNEEDGIVLFSGFYFVHGTYLKYPEQDVISPEELLASNFQYQFRDDGIRIGRYKFDFQCEQRPIHLIPEDMPEGCITILFDAQWDKEELDSYICKD